MKVKLALLAIAVWTAPALAQDRVPKLLQPIPPESALQLGKSNFTMPVVDYRAPDGTWKRGQGIIIGREVSPNATVGLGFFRMKPKYEESGVPTSGKSKKVAIGLSMKF